MEPRLGGAVSGADIPPVDYLDWYIPRLGEHRPHDLSQSGYAHPWDFSELLGSIDDADLGGFWSTGQDPREWVAARHGVTVSNVCIGHGVSQALTLAILSALPADGPRVLGVEMPSYAPVSQCARLLGCEVVEFHRVEVDGAWVLNRDSLLEVLPSVAAIVLTPMHNPSGWMLTQADEDWLVEVTREAGVNVISDEVYIDAAIGTEFYRPMFERGDHIISVNSLTKCYGLGGLRFGWLIGAPDLIRNASDAFHNLQGMASAPSMALAGAAWPHLDAALARLNENRSINLPLLLETLAAQGIDFVPPPTGIFGLIRIGMDSVRAMAEHGKPLGLLATPGSMFDVSLKNHLRIAWGGDPVAFAEAMPVLGAFLTRIQESNASSTD